MPAAAEGEREAAVALAATAAAQTTVLPPLEPRPPGRLRSMGRRAGGSRSWAGPPSSHGRNRGQSHLNTHSPSRPSCRQVRQFRAAHHVLHFVPYKQQHAVLQQAELPALCRPTVQMSCMLAPHPSQLNGPSLVLFAGADTTDRNE